MKQTLKLISYTFLLILIIWPVYYFVNKKYNTKITYKLQRPERRDIRDFIICSGIISAKEEVEIKSRVSGILKELYVKNGERVHKNEVIAKIAIIPSMEELSIAESNVNIAKINFDKQKNSYNRNKILIEKEIISKVEFEKSEFAFLKSKEELSSAKKRCQIIKSGNYSTTKQSNTLIISTIDGVVTLLPAKIGSTIIQSNNFNEGTTIANIANMDEMVFKGDVKEYDVSKLNKGMKVIINTSISDKNERGILTEVSTSGKNVDGLILFSIKSVLEDSKIKKTGFSANAKIIVEEKHDVLTIKEEWLTIKHDSTYVFVQKNENDIEKRFVKLGLSDGIYTEVISGLKDYETIRVYDK